MSPLATKILSSALSVAQTIADMVSQGASDEEIKKRLADPNGVGKELLAAIKTRKKKLEDFVDG